MDLLWPGFLFLLGLIPLLIAAYLWVLRRRKRFTLRYSSLALVHDAHPEQARWRRHIPFALFVMALFSLVLALIRPVAIVPMPVTKRTVILAIDISRSMCATDILPNRLEAAKAAAIDFIQRQNTNTHIGVVAFAGFAAIIQPPTTDQEVLLDAIENLSTARRTAIGSGILKSIDAIAEIDESIEPGVFNPAETVPFPVPQGVFSPAIIVVLTDGVTNVGPPPLDAAQQALERGIRVYTIGFGTAENNSIPNCGRQSQGGDPSGFGGGFGGGGFRRGIDEVTLQQVADLTGGAYYVAESSSELQRVFQGLPTDLIVKNEAMEISVAFAALAALLVGVAILLSLLWNPML